MSSRKLAPAHEPSDVGERAYRLARLALVLIGFLAVGLVYCATHGAVDLPVAGLLAAATGG